VSVAVLTAAARSDVVHRRDNFVSYTTTHYGADFGYSCFYNTPCLSDPAQWGASMSNAGSRAWRWQKCREMAWFQVAPPTNSMRAAALSIQALLQQCQDIFGISNPSVDQINQAYGGDQPPTTNVFFSQGSDDPWRPAGVLKSLSPSLQEFTANCDGCGHCQDLHSPAAGDSNAVTQQRVLEVVFFDEILRSVGWTYRNA
jgi:hypothetical protein